MLITKNSATRPRFRLESNRQLSLNQYRPTRMAVSLVKFAMGSPCWQWGQCSPSSSSILGSKHVSLPAALRRCSLAPIGPRYPNVEHSTRAAALTAARMCDDKTNPVAIGSLRRMTFSDARAPNSTSSRPKRVDPLPTPPLIAAPPQTGAAGATIKDASIIRVHHQPLSSVSSPFVAMRSHQCADIRLPPCFSAILRGENPSAAPPIGSSCEEIHPIRMAWVQG